ncbi:MAG: phosphotransferase [Nanoarchaeota archaeon]|nr:phosphotransferase [Nanoarchaeota archaeon]
MSPKQVAIYARSLGRRVFGANIAGRVNVKALPVGIWNLNYMAQINGQKYVFKIYSKNIPDLLFGNNGKDEYLALELIRDLEIAPRPINFEFSELFGMEVLVYRYLEGTPLSEFTPVLLENNAINLAKLHSFDIKPITILPKKIETTRTLMDEITSTFNRCIDLNIPPKKLASYKHLIAKAKNYAKDVKESTPKYALTHGDLAPCNIIVYGTDVKFIDWQRPTITDPAFDVWAFAEDAFIRWDLAKPLTNEQKRIFIDKYISLTDDAKIMDRMRLKSPLYYLNIGLYCLMRYHDFLSGRIDRSRTKGREHLWKKYDTTEKVCSLKLKEVFQS